MDDVIRRTRSERQQRTLHSLQFLDIPSAVCAPHAALNTARIELQHTSSIIENASAMQSQNGSRLAISATGSNSLLKARDYSTSGSKLLQQTMVAEEPRRSARDAWSAALQELTATSASGDGRSGRLRRGSDSRPPRPGRARTVRNSFGRLSRLQRRADLIDRRREWSPGPGPVLASLFASYGDFIAYLACTPRLVSGELA